MKNKTSIIWTLDKKELIQLIDESNSFSDVIRKLNLSTNGASNHSRLKTRLEFDGIDYKSLIEKGRKVCRTFVKSMSIEDILVVNSSYSRASLKRRLLKLSLLKNECSCCGQQPIWNGQKLVMVLDHKNGINNDNRLENLRLLCPNCNSQTNTFAGKSKTKFIKEIFSCSKCGTKVRKGSNFCKDCRVLIKPIIVTRCPTKEELEKLLWEKPTTKLAEQFGVSDKAVEKWSKKYGLEKPPRGYWAKKKFGK